MSDTDAKSFEINDGIGDYESIEYRGGDDSQIQPGVLAVETLKTWKR